MLRIRLFSPLDVNGVSSLVRTTLGEAYPPTLYLDLYHWWREGFVVAENSGQIIGFVAGVVSSPGHARILMLAVETPYRRQGIGTQLMTSFMRECAMKGMKTVELEVRQSNNDAVRFYQNHGFQLSHTLPRFYTDGEDGFKLIKNL